MSKHREGSRWAESESGRSLGSPGKPAQKSSTPDEPALILSEQELPTIYPSAARAHLLKLVPTVGTSSQNKISGAQVPLSQNLSSESPSHSRQQILPPPRMRTITELSVFAHSVLFSKVWSSSQNSQFSSASGLAQLVPPPRAIFLATKSPIVVLVSRNTFVAPTRHSFPVPKLTVYFSLFITI